MKKILPFLSFLAITSLATAQIVINEIMYNPPESGNDSLEYVEIFNHSGAAVDLTDYTFTQGVEFTFPQFILEADGYIVICSDTTVLQNVLGITNAFQFESGALSNGGEDIVLEDAQGNMVDVVDYANGGDWPINANGEGSSLELCDPNRDNSDPANWKASTSGKGVVINDREVKGTPGEANNVSCADHTVRVVSNFFDPDTLRINVGETVEWICTEGRHNVNGSLATYPDNPEGFRSGPAEDAPWSYSFTFTQEGSYDYRCDPHFLLNMIGHVIVENNVPPALVITEIMYNDPASDSLEFVEIFNNSDVPVQLNGLRMINAISHEFQDMMLAEQSYLVLARDKATVDAAFGISSIQWDNGQLNNSGEAIEIIDGNGNTIDRVEYSADAPWDAQADGGGYSLILCDVLMDNNDGNNWGISSNDAGFQINGEDIFANPGGSDVCVSVRDEYPRRSIDVMTSVDAGGLPDSIGFKCALQGIVYGVDLQGGEAIQFTLIDQTGGIGVFSNENFNYTVTEGDELVLKGTITQFNGLTQIQPDSLRILSTGNGLSQAQAITQLDESTESEFILIDAPLVLVDPGEWDESGDSFTARITDGTNEYMFRVDSDTDVAGRPRPTDPFRLFGIGGQFDSSDPYTEGYQISPRYFEDLDFMSSTSDPDVNAVKIYPNPAQDKIVLVNLPSNAEVMIKDISGKTILQSNEKTISLNQLVSGIYIVEIHHKKAMSALKIVKE